MIECRLANATGCRLALSKRRIKGRRRKRRKKGYSKQTR
jgi:hypothetical protein